MYPSNYESVSRELTGHNLNKFKRQNSKRWNLPGIRAVEPDEFWLPWLDPTDGKKFVVAWCDETVDGNSLHPESDDLSPRCCCIPRPVPFTILQPKSVKRNKQVNYPAEQTLDGWMRMGGWMDDEMLIILYTVYTSIPSIVNWYQLVSGLGRDTEHNCHAVSLRRASHGQKAVWNPEICLEKKSGKKQNKCSVFPCLLTIDTLWWLFLSIFSSPHIVREIMKTTVLIIHSSYHSQFLSVTPFSFFDITWGCRLLRDPEWRIGIVRQLPVQRSLYALQGAEFFIQRPSNTFQE